MPHLSPMNWPLTLLTFILILLISTASNWWAQVPRFPDMSPSKVTPPMKWTW